MFRTLFVLALTPFVAFAQEDYLTNNILHVKLEPTIHVITVVDSMTFNAPDEAFLKGRPFGFYINRAITIDTIYNSKGTIKWKEADSSFQNSIWIEDSLSLPYYDVAKFIYLESFEQGANTIILQYHGEIFDTSSSSERPYQKGFDYTSGIIDTNGVYLPGAAFWTPTIPEA